MSVEYGAPALGKPTHLSAASARTNELEHKTIDRRPHVSKIVPQQLHDAGPFLRGAPAGPRATDRARSAREPGPEPDAERSLARLRAGRARRATRGCDR